MDSGEERLSASCAEMSVEYNQEEQEAADSTPDSITSPPAQLPFHMLSRDAYPTPSESQDELTDELTDERTDDETEEEDWRAIGAAALRGVGAGLIAPATIPPDIPPLE